MYRVTWKQERPVAEFTGERVIPGLVDADLFNEHLARYLLAGQLAGARTGPLRVLDAACGAGYGAREFPAHAQVISVDVAAEAVIAAREAGCTAVRASCEALPFAPRSFDMIAAFEMIEHLQEPGAFLRQAAESLRPGGLLLVSTPNREYYAEARAAAGPNPFHTREFTFDEFRGELLRHFAHVRVLTQNHSAAIVFAPVGTEAAPSTQTAGSVDPTTAHFFLAVCSAEPLPDVPGFVWVPDSGNVLRERERHIARLEGEVRDKTDWLAQLHGTHAELQSKHVATEAELRARNRWAAQLNDELAEARATIALLQREADERLAWVGRLEADVAASNAEIVRLNHEIGALNSDLAARTAWARSLEAEKLAAIGAFRDLESASEAERSAAAEALRTTQERHDASLRMIAASRWVKLGRKLNIGPDLG